MQLSKASLTTSYSTSFQPFSDLSTRHCLECAKAVVASFLNSSSFDAKPDPRPPRANAARSKTGYPSLFAAAVA